MYSINKASHWWEDPNDLYSTQESTLLTAQLKGISLSLGGQDESTFREAMSKRGVAWIAERMRSSEIVPGQRSGAKLNRTSHTSTANLGSSPAMCSPRLVSFPPTGEFSKTTGLRAA